MFSPVLKQLMQRPHYRYTPGVLSRHSGVPKTTLMNWLSGRVARPRRWQEVAQVAAALRLDRSDTDRLLSAAGHPPLTTLIRQATEATELQLLLPWRAPAHHVASPAPPLAPAPIPVPPTPLIDRVAERSRAHALLADPHVRLVTITGPAGVGKTRLALQLAADLRQTFADGCCFVALAGITDPNLLVPTLARALWADAAPAAASIAEIGAALAEQRLLLVLDNCEHLTAAPALVGALLAAAPGLTLLVTSRSVLHVAGEHELALPPLPLPNLASLPPLAELAEVPAVALFLSRIRSVRADFQLTDANAPLVAAICVRLDGLPLAIEFAAARSKLLPLRDLLARLDQRLSFLTVAFADHPPHQQTLRDTLDWSYRLLPASARRLLMRLAVFADSWSLEAAETICAEPATANPSPTQVLDGMTLLSNHSLLQTVTCGDETRYSLLENVRVYAGERLIAGGERHTMQSRHADYYLGLADRAVPKLTGSVRTSWFAPLQQEYANLERALIWTLQHTPERAQPLVTLVAQRNC